VTSNFLIGFNWEDGASLGGSPIINYQISYDQGNNNWIVLATGVTTKTYTTTIPLVAGITYSFYVQSRNVVGLSIYSQTIAILAARIPDAPV
jgi:hypothetical protein